MTLLRSREVLPPNPTPKSKKTPIGTLQPSTPSQLHETHFPHSPPLISSHSHPASVTDSTGLTSGFVQRRRSSRLAAKSLSGECFSADRFLDNRFEGLASSERDCTSGSIEMKVDDENFEETETRGSGLATNENVGVFSVSSAVNVLGVTEINDDLSEMRPISELDFTELKGDEGKGREMGQISELDFTELKGDERKGRRKRKLIPDVPCGEFIFKDPADKECLGLRSGKRIPKPAKPGLDKVDIDDESDASTRVGDGGIALLESTEKYPRVDEDDCIKSSCRLSKLEKGKWTVDDLNLGGHDVIELHSELSIEKSSDKKVDDQDNGSAHDRAVGEENENGKNESHTSSCNVSGNTDANTGKEGRESLRVNKNFWDLVTEALLAISDHIIETEPNVNSEGISQDSEALEDERQANNEGNNNFPMQPQEAREQQRRRYSLRTAHSFARFYDDNPGNNSPADAEGGEVIEDWPGPFSTALKIARDRAKGRVSGKKNSSEKNNPAAVKWIPRKSERHNLSKLLPPSLKDLSLLALAKNADAITSLDYVPDSFRHMLSRVLCGSRTMNVHFLNLLLSGSPTEVSISDCSWLDEKQFLKSFQDCDTSKLMVLKLDQCARCITDHVLLFLQTLSNRLPVLKHLSLSGACSLSDNGITALISLAPGLESINLSQCSFITSASIHILANSLGSTLREMYLNDCQNLEPMLMVPALKNLEHLEVLSLAGIPNVCDSTLQEFITTRGHNMKELILTDCVKLTDKSIKAISEACSALLAIDLVNLSQLSDFALCCLANGCPSLEKLKLSRNLFSDAALAAYVQISGETLKELSLNSVRKVSHATAMALASFSRNLVTLDLSWCRNVTDEDLGLIVDSCLSLRVLKLFGCSQVTSIFVDGHSNPDVEIIGLVMSPLWAHKEPPYFHIGAL